jgi:endonuclease/exonuclease/phosphatase family metal-dependent hydrolase
VRSVGLRLALLLGVALAALLASRDRSTLASDAGAARRFATGATPQHGRAKGVHDRSPAAARGSAFESRAACEDYLRGHPRRSERGPRIGSWNIRWFPYGTKDGHDPERRTDLEWLACAIASLDVDVLGVEEIVQDPGGRNALLDLLARLDVLTQGRWRAELDECAGSGRQHLGFLLDASRVDLGTSEPIAALNPGRSACDRNLRPGYGVYLRFHAGPDLEVAVVHLDAGTTARDFGNRQRSLGRLGEVAAAIERREHDSDLLVLGDFNTMGCKDCEPPVAADDEIAQLDARLGSTSLRRVLLPEARACTHYQRGHAGTLDHVLASSAMQELPPGARLEVFGSCRDLACNPPARGEHPAALERLSDHCPIVLELLAQDLDHDAKRTSARVSSAPLGAHGP